MTLTREYIESLRDQTFHRTREGQVTSVDQALEFVKQVGFCFAFTAKNSELPCLWHAACGQRDPQWPEHTHHDPYISLVWVAKDALVAEKKIYYGKAIKKRPSMISLEYFPYFYALSGRGHQSDSYIAQYMRGQLSPQAKRIMDALSENSPQTTADLKISSSMAHPRKRYAFDRAMAELQMNFYVVKIAEFYEPFTFLWELVDRRFTDEIEQAKKINPDQARIEILHKYFQNVIVSEVSSIRRLFGWSQVDIEKALSRLVNDDFLRDDIRISGERKQYYGLRSLH